MKKIIFIWVILTCFLVLIYAPTAFATTEDLNFSYAGQPGPIFTETNLVPGEIRTKLVNVTNLSSQDRNFALNLANFFGSSDQKLAQALSYQLSRNNILIASGDVSDLEDQETSIETISANQTYVYNFAIKMKDVGNEYQNQKVSFDIILAFKDDGKSIKAILGKNTGPVAVSELPQTGMDIAWSLIGFVGLLLVSLVYQQYSPKKLAK